MFDDFDLIVSSFASQYGIRLYSTPLSWVEFISLISGLDSETPLGRIVSIRSETDMDMLKHFSAEQHRIRNEWHKKAAQNVNMDKYNDAMNYFSSMFRGMAEKDGD